jgi:hypothetical protein
MEESTELFRQGNRILLGQLQLSFLDTHPVETGRLLELIWCRHPAIDQRQDKQIEIGPAALIWILSHVQQVYEPPWSRSSPDRDLAKDFILQLFLPRQAEGQPAREPLAQIIKSSCVVLYELLRSSPSQQLGKISKVHRRTGLIEV